MCEILRWLALAVKIITPRTEAVKQTSLYRKVVPRVERVNCVENDHGYSAGSTRSSA